MRRKYRQIIRIMLWLIGFIVFIMCFWAEMSLQEFVLSVAAPLLPFLPLGNM